MACNHNASGKFADLRQLFAQMQQAGFFNRKERCDRKVVEKRQQRLADDGNRMAEIAAVVRHCPDCAVRFYRELLALLKDFAFPGNPDAILCWGLCRLGYSYSQVEVLLATHLFRASRVHGADFDSRDLVAIAGEFRDQGRKLAATSEIEVVKPGRHWLVIESNGVRRARYSVTGGDDGSLEVSECMSRETMRTNVYRARVFLAEISVAFELDVNDATGGR